MKPIVIKRNQFTQSAPYRVVEVFFQYPEKSFSLSEVAIEAKVAKPNVGSILQKLEEQSHIIITKLAKLWRICADRENPNFIRKKVVYNLNCIYQSGLIEFLNDHFKNPKAIILFGSYRQGEDLSSSDIDIAIETDAEEYQTLRLKGATDFEKRLKRKIQFHVFSRGKIDIHLFNNMANGIVLSGFLEVKP